MQEVLRMSLGTMRHSVSAAAVVLTVEVNICEKEKNSLYFIIWNTTIMTLFLDLT